LMISRDRMGTVWGQDRMGDRMGSDLKIELLS
jgi:hypothetical protein